MGVDFNFHWLNKWINTYKMHVPAKTLQQIFRILTKKLTLHLEIIFKHLAIGKLS